MQNSDLLTLPAMARHLKVTQAWLRTEVDAHRLPALNANGRLLFNVPAVERVVLERAKIAEAAR